MEAIRQYLKVNGRTLEVILPDDFMAEEVEVIILAKDDTSGLSAEMKLELDRRLNEPVEDYISAEQSLQRLKNKNGL